MENVILCNGSYAENPYLPEGENIRLFSVEELCCYLYKNAFLIQEEFFSEPLLRWIGDELRLPEWAEKLRLFKGKDGSVLHSIDFLFRVTGYYGEEEISHVRGVLKESNHLSVMERRKIRADMYCKKQRYAMAAAEYEYLLKETEEEQIKFRAKLYHNLGVCQAGLFLYDKAAESFGQAFQIYPNTESYVQLLTALKLGSSPEEYLTYLSAHPESYEDSLEVESRITRVEESWEKMPFQNMLQEMTEEGNTAYYETVKKLLNQAKQDYINMVDKR